MAKRCNEKRVMAEAVKWGERGARLNGIAPGIIVTPLAIDEFHGPRGDFYKNMFAKCPAGRPGTADEVANVAELLMSSKGRVHHRLHGADRRRRHLQLLLRPPEAPEVGKPSLALARFGSGASQGASAGPADTEYSVKTIRFQLKNFSILPFLQKSKYNEFIKQKIFL